MLGFCVLGNGHVNGSRLNSMYCATVLDPKIEYEGGCFVFCNRAHCAVTLQFDSFNVGFLAVSNVLTYCAKTKKNRAVICFLQQDPLCCDTVI